MLLHAGLELWPKLARLHLCQAFKQSSVDVDVDADSVWIICLDQNNVYFHN